MHPIKQFAFRHDVTDNLCLFVTAHDWLYNQPTGEISEDLFGIDRLGEAYDPDAYISADSKTKQGAELTLTFHRAVTSDNYNVTIYSYIKSLDKLTAIGSLQGAFTGRSTIQFSDTTDPDHYVLAFFDANNPYYYKIYVPKQANNHSDPTKYKISSQQLPFSLPSVHSKLVDINGDKGLAFFTASTLSKNKKRSERIVSSDQYAINLKDNLIYYKYPDGGNYSPVPFKNGVTNNIQNLDDIQILDNPAQPSGNPFYMAGIVDIEPYDEEYFSVTAIVKTHPKNLPLPCGFNSRWNNNIKIGDIIFDEFFQPHYNNGVYCVVNKHRGYKETFSNRIVSESVPIFDDYNPANILLDNFNNSALLSINVESSQGNEHIIYNIGNVCSLKSTHWNKEDKNNIVYSTLKNSGTYRGITSRIKLQNTAKKQIPSEWDLSGIYRNLVLEPSQFNRIIEGLGAGRSNVSDSAAQRFEPPKSIFNGDKMGYGYSVLYNYNRYAGFKLDYEDSPIGINILYHGNLMTPEEKAALYSSSRDIIGATPSFRSAPGITKWDINRVDLRTEDYQITEVWHKFGDATSHPVIPNNNCHKLTSVSLLDGLNTNQRNAIDSDVAKNQIGYTAYNTVTPTFVVSPNGALYVVDFKSSADFAINDADIQPAEIKDLRFNGPESYKKDSVIMTFSEVYNRNRTWYNCISGLDSNTIKEKLNIPNVINHSFELGKRSGFKLNTGKYRLQNYSSDYLVRVAIGSRKDIVVDEHNSYYRSLIFGDDNRYMNSFDATPDGVRIKEYNAIPYNLSAIGGNSVNSKYIKILIKKSSILNDTLPKGIFISDTLGITDDSVIPLSDTLRDKLNADDSKLNTYTGFKPKYILSDNFHNFWQGFSVNSYTSKIYFFNGLLPAIDVTETNADKQLSDDEELDLDYRKDWVALQDKRYSLTNKVKQYFAPRSLYTSSNDAYAYENIRSIFYTKDNEKAWVFYAGGEVKLFDVKDGEVFAREDREINAIMQKIDNFDYALGLVDDNTALVSLKNGDIGQIEILNVPEMSNFNANDYTGMKYDFTKIAPNSDGTITVRIPIYDPRGDSILRIIKIDWGDGKTTTHRIKKEDDNLTTIEHKYPATYANRFVHVKIYGDLYCFGGHYKNDWYNYRTKTGEPSLKGLVECTSLGSSLKAMYATFFGCENLTHVPLDIPESVTSLAFCFMGATNFNNEILRNWNIKNVTSLYYTFALCKSFNVDIGSWNTGRVTRADACFWGCEAFDQNLSAWDTSNMTYMTSMFNGATNFDNGGNNNIRYWNTANVVSFAYMFSGCQKFNKYVDYWNVSKATNFTYMFNECKAYNMPMTNWIPTSSATNVDGMFNGAEAFNRAVDWLDLSKCTHVPSLFNNAKAFNKDIVTLDTSSVTNFNNMLANNSWNQPSLSKSCFGILFKNPNGLEVSHDDENYQVRYQSSRTTSTRFPGWSPFGAYIQKWTYSNVDYTRNIVVWQHNTNANIHIHEHLQDDNAKAWNYSGQIVTTKLDINTGYDVIASKEADSALFVNGIRMKYTDGTNVILNAGAIASYNLVEADYVKSGSNIGKYALLWRHKTSTNGFVLWYVDPVSGFRETDISLTLIKHNTICKTYLLKKNDDSILFFGVHSTGYKSTYYNELYATGSSVARSLTPQSAIYDERSGYPLILWSRSDGNFLAWHLDTNYTLHTAWYPPDKPTAAPVSKNITVTHNGSRFLLNGTTNVNVIEGRTYKFDLSDVSNRGKLFLFSTKADGTHRADGLGHNYIIPGMVRSGTSGTADAYIEVTIPYKSPTLYYYDHYNSGHTSNANLYTYDPQYPYYELIGDYDFNGDGIKGAVAGYELSTDNPPTRFTPKFTVDNATSMTGFFNTNKVVNCSLNDWDLSKCTDFSYFLYSAHKYNKNLNHLNLVNNVKLTNSFNSALVMNSVFSDWNVSKVDNMFGTFCNTYAFTGRGLSGWQTNRVKNFGYCFYNSRLMQTDISNWNFSGIDSTVAPDPVKAKHFALELFMYNCNYNYYYDLLTKGFGTIPLEAFEVTEDQKIYYFLAPDELDGDDYNNRIVNNVGRIEYIEVAGFNENKPDTFNKYSIRGTNVPFPLYTVEDSIDGTLKQFGSVAARLNGTMRLDDRGYLMDRKGARLKLFRIFITNTFNANGKESTKKIYYLICKLGSTYKNFELVEVAKSKSVNEYSNIAYTSDFIEGMKDFVHAHGYSILDDESIKSELTGRRLFAFSKSPIEKPGSYGYQYENVNFSRSTLTEFQKRSAAVLNIKKKLQIIDNTLVSDVDQNQNNEIINIGPWPGWTNGGPNANMEAYSFLDSNGKSRMLEKFGPKWQLCGQSSNIPAGFIYNSFGTFCTKRPAEVELTNIACREDNIISFTIKNNGQDDSFLSNIGTTNINYRPSKYDELPNVGYVVEFYYNAYQRENIYSPYFSNKEILLYKTYLTANSLQYRGDLLNVSIDIPEVFIKGNSYNNGYISHIHISAGNSIGYGKAAVYQIGIDKTPKATVQEARSHMLKDIGHSNTFSPTFKLPYVPSSIININSKNYKPLTLFGTDPGPLRPAFAIIPNKSTYDSLEPVSSYTGVLQGALDNLDRRDNLLCGNSWRLSTSKWVSAISFDFDPNKFLPVTLNGPKGFTHGTTKRIDIYKFPNSAVRPELPYVSFEIMYVKLLDTLSWAKNKNDFYIYETINGEVTGIPIGLQGFWTLKQFVTGEYKNGNSTLPRYPEAWFKECSRVAIKDLWTSLSSDDQRSLFNQDDIGVLAKELAVDRNLAARNHQGPSFNPFNNTPLVKTNLFRSSSIDLNRVQNIINFWYADGILFLDFKSPGDYWEYNQDLAYQIVISSENKYARSESVSEIFTADSMKQITSIGDCYFSFVDRTGLIETDVQWK